MPLTFHTFSMLNMLNTQIVKNRPGKGQTMKRILSQLVISQGGIVIYLSHTRGNSTRNTKRSKYPMSAQSNSCSSSSEVSNIAYFSFLLFETAYTLTISLIVSINFLIFILLLFFPYPLTQDFLAGDVVGLAFLPELVREGFSCTFLLIDEFIM